MITVTVSTIKLSFDTDSRFNALIHLCFDTFSASQVPAAYNIDGCSALAVKTLIAKLAL